jgi:aspartate kinase
MLRVFKFGGASVMDATAVRNVADILKEYPEDELVVIISAMGKTTNALENILEAYWNNSGKCADLISNLKKFHVQIVQDLFGSNSEYISAELELTFQELSNKCGIATADNYHFEYDQIVSLGEVLSTKIIHAYLESIDLNCSWLDARKLVVTNNKWCEARINWNVTTERILSEVKDEFSAENKIVVSQGFIGHTVDDHTTTLGREGSDFSAAIFAYVLDADEVTIWKDVPGMLNADPKWFDNTILLEKISFREAIELAYFGASVIHPRTIQPLKRKNIPLYIRSFVNPESKGTIIQQSEEDDTKVPSFIFRMDQVLISLSPRDFSFVIEENLEEIFSYLNQEGIRMNIMQNSAVSFSFCCDQSKIDIEKITTRFTKDYIVKYNEPLELVTIRHYDDATLERVTKGKKVILEQKSRETARLVMLSN